MLTTTTAKEDPKTQAPEKPEPSGVYVCIRPTKTSAARIKNFFSLAGLKTLDAADMHCTLMFAEKDDLADYSDDIVRDRLTEPCPTAMVKGYDLFGKDKECLVMKLKSDTLHDIFEELKGLGLKHSYPSFEPHITLSYDAKGFKKSTLPVPDFEIFFNPWIEVKAIDDEYKAQLEGVDGLRFDFTP